MFHVFEPLSVTSPHNNVMMMSPSSTSLSEIITLSNSSSTSYNVVFSSPLEQRLFVVLNVTTNDNDTEPIVVVMCSSSCSTGESHTSEMIAALRVGGAVTLSPSPSATGEDISSFSLCLSSSRCTAAQILSMPLSSSLISATTVDMDSLRVQRQKQAAYVNKIRGMFIEAERTMSRNYEVEEAIEVLEVDEEPIARINNVCFDELFEFEQICVEDVIEREEIGFRAIQHIRTRDQLVPWCTLACNFCCQTKEDWRRLTNAHHEEQQRSLALQHCAVHEDLSLLFEVNRETLLISEFVDTQVIRKKMLERNTYLHSENSARSIVVEEEERGRHHIERQVELYKLSITSATMNYEVERREYEVHRMHLDLALREVKLHKRLLEVVELEEASMRQRLATQEDLVRSAAKSKLAAVTMRCHIQEREKEFAAIVTARDALRAEVEAHEERIAAIEIEKQQKMQSDLQQEFDLLKKCKKATAATALPPPLCIRCLEPFTDPVVHRTTECTQRPIECKMCKQIYPAADIEAHVESTCSQRPVECPTCHVYYRAFYVDEHISKCEIIARARGELADCHPTIPFEIKTSETGNPGEEERDGGTVIESVTRNSVVDRKGVVAGDSILSIGGRATPTRLETMNILIGVGIGQALEILVLSGEGTRIGFSWVVQTSVPLDKYNSMLGMVTQDNLQQLKPPSKKRSKSATKKK
eukprot:PhM_4_TR13455/c0_g1_i1/m.51031